VPATQPDLAQMPPTRSTLWAWTALLLSVFLVAPAVPAEPAPFPNQEELVTQLGDASSKVRDEALRQLQPKAWEIRETIAAGLLNPDPERRWRFGELWDDLRAQYLQEFTAAENVGTPSGLPGWDRFRELLGDTMNTRRLYAAIIEAEEDVISAMAFQNAGIGEKTDFSGGHWLPVYVNRRCQELLKNNTATAATVFAFQFAAIVYERKNTPETSALLSDLALSGAVQDAVQQSEAARALFSLWMEKNPSVQGFGISMRLQLPKTRTIASDLVTNANAPAAERLNPILFLAREGTPADGRLLAPLLEDRSLIDTFLSKGQVVKLQLRDVALAASIHLAGKDPLDFGFNQRKEDPDTLYRPGSLGFADENQRNAAFEQWKKFVAETNPFPSEPVPSPAPAVVPEAVLPPPPPALAPDTSQDWPQPGVVVEGEDELTRRDGIKFGGRLLSSPEIDGTFLWGKDGVPEPRRIPFSEVLRIKLAGVAPTKETAPASLVTLTNGDIFAGNLVEMNEEKLTIKTDYAGDVSINRFSVSSIDPNPATDAGYAGPQDASEWALASLARGWKYHDGALFSQGPGSISRSLSWTGVPVGIEFRLDWKSLAQMQMRIGDSGTNGLLLKVGNGRAAMEGVGSIRLRLTQPAGRVQVRNDKSLATPEASARFFLFIDPDEKTVSLFVNGRRIQKANIEGDLSSARSRILFSSQTKGMTLRNIKISKRFPKRDGFPVLPAPAASSTDDFLMFSNFDSSSGRVGQLADGRISCQVGHLDLILPLSRFAKIDFSRDGVERSRREEGDVFVLLQNGTRLTLRLEAIDEASITGRSESFGLIRVDRRAVSGLSCNVHDKISGVFLE
jgi:hypothetical protein